MSVYCLFFIRQTPSIFAQKTFEKNYLFYTILSNGHDLYIYIYR